MWEIETSSLLLTFHLEYSIISLSFHPFLPLLAVASGPKICMHYWNSQWSPAQMRSIETSMQHFRQFKYRHSQSLEQEIPEIDLKSSGQLQFKVVVHTRNVRAVLFHPNGEYLFTAAPDPPRPSQPASTTCRLYMFPIHQLLIRGSAKHFNPPTVALVSLPYLLDKVCCPNRRNLLLYMSQVHLYSDGGLDITADGQYLIICALFPPQVTPHPGHDESAARKTSAQSQTPTSNGFSMLPSDSTWEQSAVDRPTSAVPHFNIRRFPSLENSGSGATPARFGITSADRESYTVSLSRELGSGSGKSSLLVTGTAFSKDKSTSNGLPPPPPLQQDSSADMSASSSSDDSNTTSEDDAAAPTENNRRNPLVLPLERPIPVSLTTNVIQAPAHPLSRLKHSYSETYRSLPIRLPIGVGTWTRGVRWLLA